jgi:hypothetical protein
MCTICPDQQHWDFNTNSCTSCKDGYVYDVATHSCIRCPSDIPLEVNGICKVCP